MTTTWPSAFPEPVSGLIAQARAAKWPIEITMLFDREKQYLGYRCTLRPSATQKMDFDVTGPISFCIPADALKPEQQKELDRVREQYAPKATGGPDQCYRYEAEQSRRLAAWKREQEAAAKK
jgi:hypothetical protein